MHTAYNINVGVKGINRVLLAPHIEVAVHSNNKPFFSIAGRGKGDINVWIKYNIIDLRGSLNFNMCNKCGQSISLEVIFKSSKYYIS